MESHELQEQSEHAHHSGQKDVGLTMAIVAVLLALATLLSHRAHTKETLSLTENVDGWNFYQAKHARSYIFALAAETQALMPNGRDTAIKNLKYSLEEECGIPAPKGCTLSLIKKSPVLLDLLGSKPSASPANEAHNEAGPENKANHDAAAANPEHEAKKEKPAGEGKPKEAGGKDGAVQLQEKATEQQNETKLLEEKADFFDGAELFLEISIVLCSIALLTENRLYWKLSFISTVVGIGVAVWGLILK